MARFLSLLVASVLAAQGLAKTIDQLYDVPEGWKLQGPAEDSQVIKLQIALQQGDVEGFEQAVLDMSTPDHPNYGQHFQDHDEMKRMLLPSQETLSSVYTWLNEAGIESIEEDADWMTFKTTVGVANKALGTQFSWFVSEEAKPRRILRTLEYSVPDEVAEHINTVQPTTRFATIRANHETSSQIFEIQAIQSTAAADDCDAYITPACLKSLYKIDYEADPKSGSKVGFASYLEEYARYDDYVQFQERYLPEATGQNFSVIQYNGGLNDQDSDDDSGEANLDAQYILGTGSPLPVTEFSIGGRGPLVTDLDQPDENDNSNEPYLEFFKNVLKLPKNKLPQVISTSYGENEQSVPKSYAYSVCNLIAQLGSRGVTVIFSSGDSGTGSACQSNDGKNTTKFQPQYPASCPWVTSVGSTRYLNETATYFSSGGFSDYWSRPLWQEIAVRKYLNKIGDKFAPYYNNKGRGFPDVSVQGFGFRVFDKGVLKGYQGTSCSAPAFAGIVGLLNDARLKAKLPPVGFLNPLLYLNPHALNDITLGGSTGCDGRARFHGAPNGSPVIPYASWNATAGWDPVSGLGTPNFPKLLKAAVPFRFRA
ncbi:peptidase S8/S53 domain-containing protein [Xylaria bambusicola]|uniref:peptidase S8/S53 domain-containing protein n=1 Tax=Xylaria bambusicola TaxID=326684 RepID=UPI002007AD46|nr:peptidase S8/S53 domain-containing protein [Xylaria bambusicola]KAI0525487.1 peptidase S8/S53 domain-containing protein [Xylaria bambusicola]